MVEFQDLVSIKLLLIVLKDFYLVTIVLIRAQSFAIIYMFLGKFNQCPLLNQPMLKPRSKNTGWFWQKSTGNLWNVEAVFPTENFRIFSDDFRPIPAGKLRELTGIHQKKNPISSGYFQCFPAGSGDLPASFLEDSARSGSRNH
jgi:hypothetical protein